ncbi:MAG: TIGR01212 family radical SAM protein [Spirochaetales bacterium]|jgi:radical SAM protein (TIGR01212 family)|nr:TIGR01212 family radical SAM protein [Spirochaetales bacterium]
MWGEKRFYSLDYFYRQKFGSKVARVTIDGGFTCPNRDGTVSSGGCIFCGTSGAGEFCADKALPILQQINIQKTVLQNKWKELKIIPYFQSFTNTYAAVDVLRKKYEEALTAEECVGLSIATRADCLGNDVLDLLEELNSRTFLQVELGLQTVNDKTAQVINRGYSLDVFTQSVQALQSRGIEIVAHLIVGLPGEDRTDYLNAVRYISDMKINGVKIQVLYLLQDAPLMQWYTEGKIKFMERFEYIDTIAAMLSYLSPQVVVHRLTGDPPWRSLIEPKWTTDKKQILNQINQYLKEKNIYQGCWRK